MKNCTCTESVSYHGDHFDVVYHICDYCHEQQMLQDAEIDEYYHMIDCLEEWLGKKVKPLRVGKPKPGIPMNDELPF